MEDDFTKDDEMTKYISSHYFINIDEKYLTNDFLLGFLESQINFSSLLNLENGVFYTQINKDIYEVKLLFDKKISGIDYINKIYDYRICVQEGDNIKIIILT